MSLLEFKDVSFINNNQSILKEVTLSIDSGGYISIVGPSGSGKSTFLKLCSNLISPSEGSILYKEKSIEEYNPTDLRKDISYCFQTPHLFGNTVMDNISFSYSIRNMTLDINRVEELLDMFNLSSNYLNKNITNLSGGEIQRISLIRNLLFKPEILLLDEVTSALDMENTLIVEDVMDLLNKSGVTILWVTHNLDQSKRSSNKLLTMEAGKIKSLEVLR